jgi:hypothetical protein
MRNRGGRPHLDPTANQRGIVEQLAARGESRLAIASAIGIAPMTLDRHFDRELKDGRAKRWAEVIGMLFASARRGSVSAQKELLAKSRVTPPPAPAPQCNGKKRARLEGETTWRDLVAH